MGTTSRPAHRRCTGPRVCTSEPVFEHEPWFRERPEPLIQLTGSLQARTESLGPASRGGLAFTFHNTTGAVLPVYAVGIEQRLASLVGSRVAVDGKVVLVSGNAELWIGRIIASESLGGPPESEEPV